MRIKEGDEWKAAFQTNQGLFEPTIMFFGLYNSPVTFQMMMNDILQDFIHNSEAICYMDDILVYSCTLSDHWWIVHQVLSTLQSRGYFSNQRNASLSRRRLNTSDWSSQKTMWLWIQKSSMESWMRKP